MRNPCARNTYRRICTCAFALGLSLWLGGFGFVWAQVGGQSNGQPVQFEISDGWEAPAHNESMTKPTEPTGASDASEEEPDWEEFCERAEEAGGLRQEQRLETRFEDGVTLATRR